MPLKSGQGLQECIERPLSVLCVAPAGSERIDELRLPLNNLAGLGDTTPGRRELIVGAIFANHNKVSLMAQKISLT
jgi:hypothetical protein